MAPRSAVPSSDTTDPASLLLPIVDIAPPPPSALSGRASTSAAILAQAPIAPAGQASPSPSPLPDLRRLARTVLKAKRIAVVCGAGISTATGIPDFRSGAGLFESLKKQYPDARLTSGKDLFDVGLFQSEQTASIFYNMIAELHRQADGVAPTPFHSWLKQLDDEGKLFRVYTQNIDALEEKAGLTYGLGDKSLPLPPRRRTAASRSPSKRSASGSATPSTASPFVTSTSAHALGPSSSQVSVASTSSSTCPSPRSSLSPPPTHSTIPRCIPLHGHLGTLSCSFCKLVTPTSPYLDLLASGSAPLCPACLQKEALRASAGERARGVGVLRPDVVLYGEEHKDGDRVGEITQRDLLGARPDLLLVVGTTLKVKGTKRLVRELAKVIKPVVGSGGGGGGATTTAAAQSGLGPSTAPKPTPVHTIYLNAEFPSPAREWADVFDVWCRGDIQAFVAALAAEARVVEQEAVQRDERRRVRVEAARLREEKKLKAAELAAAVAGIGAVGSAMPGQEETKPRTGSVATPAASPTKPRPPPMDRSQIPPRQRSASPRKKASAAAATPLTQAAAAGPTALPRLDELAAREKENTLRLDYTTTTSAVLPGSVPPARRRSRTSTSPTACSAAAPEPISAPVTASSFLSGSSGPAPAMVHSAVPRTADYASAGPPPAKRPRLSHYRTHSSAPAGPLLSSAHASDPQPFTLILGGPSARPGPSSSSSSSAPATISSSRLNLQELAPATGSLQPAVAPWPFELPVTLPKLPELPAGGFTAGAMAAGSTGPKPLPASGLTDEREDGCDRAGGSQPETPFSQFVGGGGELLLRRTTSSSSLSSLSALSDLGDEEEEEGTDMDPVEAGLHREAGTTTGVTGAARARSKTGSAPVRTRSGSGVAVGRSESPTSMSRGSALSRARPAAPRRSTSGSSTSTTTTTSGSTRTTRSQTHARRRSPRRRSTAGSTTVTPLPSSAGQKKQTGLGFSVTKRRGGIVAGTKQKR